MKVVWTRSAFRHLAALRNHIAKGSEKNSADGTQRILAAVALVSRQPEIGRSGQILGTWEFDCRRKWPGKL